MEENMFYGASNLLFENAKELRNNLTNAERIRWCYLKVKLNGFKFRRQHPLGSYIVDFYCHKLKLVIELDGSIHDNEEVKLNDEVRQKLMEGDGLTVMRFKNEEVFKGITNVLQAIDTKCNELASAGTNKVSL